MIPAYPLQWPAGWPRTPVAQQRPGKFGTKKPAISGNWLRTVDITIAEATKRVLDELGRMGIDRKDIVISTNLQLRLDGLPLSKQRAVTDAGAAVYWQARKGERRVMAIDQYYKVEENLAAIAATLDAMRAIERHGGAQILDRAFTGFTALPAPTAPRSWREVFGFAPGDRVERYELRAQYRRLASERHPDRAGGSDAAMSELNVAMAEAEKEIGSCGR
jgi:DnaJ-domain-containing protein 1